MWPKKTAHCTQSFLYSPLYVLTSLSAEVAGNIFDDLVATYFLDCYFLTLKTEINRLYIYSTGKAGNDDRMFRWYRLRKGIFQRSVCLDGCCCCCYCLLKKDVMHIDCRYFASQSMSILADSWNHGYIHIAVQSQ